MDTQPASLGRTATTAAIFLSPHPRGAEHTDHQLARLVLLRRYSRDTRCTRIFPATIGVTRRNPQNSCTEKPRLRTKLAPLCLVPLICPFGKLTELLSSSSPFVHSPVDICAADGVISLYLSVVVQLSILHTPRLTCVFVHPCRGLPPRSIHRLYRIALS